MIIIIIVIIIIMIFGRKLGIGGVFFFPAPPNFPDHALIFSRVFHLRFMAAGDLGSRLRHPYYLSLRSR